MIDFHAHLDLYPDPHAAARECIARNLYVLSVTTTPSAWAGTAALTEGAPRIQTALGLHPQIAHERKAELALFEELLPRVRYVGEIGLDGVPEYRRHWPDQQRVFTRILELCERAGGRIMTLHSRRATTAVLDGLSAHPDAGTPVLHWFSGTQRELTRAVDLGCWFSVGPAMLSGDKGRQLVLKMPRERVLTESDGPFAQIDGRAAWPWDVVRAVETLAQLWSEPPDAVDRQLRENLRGLTANGG
ncbi:Qat anti-phage system TatD family nuclease QatD [Rhodoligotrophos defluvii]|uniref:Qat anti-phage system TatD family nuclease QatD n=1 Tax=Rhodoligotrophos defluvii TaxID=2561934 RepID=UPI0010C9EDB4|nr:Qat anti-phage system TatD family nuclease QatD [Rhodoligotrophos defluvii]